MSNRKRKVAYAALALTLGISSAAAPAGIQSVEGDKAVSLNGV